LSVFNKISMEAAAHEYLLQFSLYDFQGVVDIFKFAGRPNLPHFSLNRDADDGSRCTAASDKLWLPICESLVFGWYR